MTEELYDLSTMAMEYFKEHLEPRLPTLVNFNRDFIDYNFSKSEFLMQPKLSFITPVHHPACRQLKNEIPAGHANLV